MSAPLPNPPFVFPAQDPVGEHSRQSETTTSERLPLPAFSFNPGSVGSDQTTPSAPFSNRAGGHRRQYSEFVGSDRLVTPGNITAGQANEEDLTTPVKLPPPGPGFSAANRRRHAHRRSAAISSVDLTAMTNALDVKSYAESAPCTPADLQKGNKSPQEPSQPLSYLPTNQSRPTPPASPKLPTDATYSAPQVSTERRLSSPLLNTETAIDNPKAEVSVQPETPARKSDATISFSKTETPPSQQISRPRPRTADASLMLEQDGLPDGSSPSKRPSSAAGHTRFNKSMSSGILNAALRKTHVEDGYLSSSPPRHSSSDDDSDTSADDDHEVSNSPLSASKKKTKSKKRQKKVRSWAGSLLIRKGKGHHSKKEISETEPNKTRPPALTRTNSDLGSGLDVEFDDDNIVVIRTPTNPTHPETKQASSGVESWASLESSWKPRSFYEQSTAADSRSPVIDLDAALGPFNTPDMGSGAASETGFSAATKRMYSGGRRGEFVGPEMRYHRRAESAPEMPPFDRSFLGTHRFPTTSSLENPDVFYEEEEDAFLAATSGSGRDSEEQLPIQATRMESKDDKSGDSGQGSDTLTGQLTAKPSPEEHTGLGIQKTRTSDAAPAPIVPSVSQESFNTMERRFYLSQPQQPPPSFSGQPKTPIETGKQEGWQSRMPLSPSPEVSPRFLPTDHRPVTSPTELSSAITPFSLHGGCSLQNSAFPSPDFTISSEAPRSITTSSTTEPFPHASMEDVPSLTSSTSTMTNTLNRVSATFFSRPRLSTDRSVSLSAAAHRRSSQPSSKRSSLASLSKLVVGPHAERSKLSHEEKPPSDEPEKAKKKGRRISRLMHFWRMKDKEKLNESAE
ncbi:hypothetical protein BJX70DRAFT_397356 [Aspergillus crustosus]